MPKKALYYRATEILEDAQQTMLTSEGIKQNDSPLRKKQLDLTDRLVYCPFCLRKDMLSKFIITSKHGISRRYSKCPECNTLMLTRSIIELLSMTPQQYAHWIFNYGIGKNNFWSKCKFSVWKERLYQLGYSKEFWEKHKSLKGEYTEEE